MYLAAGTLPPIYTPQNPIGPAPLTPTVGALDRVIHHITTNC